ncbi:hypothetical protein COOONC_20410 [Cooperia oncophora]
MMIYLRLLATNRTNTAMTRPSRPDRVPGAMEWSMQAWMISATAANPWLAARVAVAWAAACRSPRGISVKRDNKSGQKYELSKKSARARTVHRIRQHGSHGHISHGGRKCYQRERYHVQRANRTGASEVSFAFTQPPTASTSKPTFTRAGLQRQYEFNSSILELIAPVAQVAPEEFDVKNLLDKAVTALRQRNELLTVNKDPEVWELFDQHGKAQSFDVYCIPFLREKKKQ